MNIDEIVKQIQKLVQRDVWELHSKYYVPDTEQLKKLINQANDHQAIYRENTSM